MLCASSNISTLEHSTNELHIVALHACFQVCFFVGGVGLREEQVAQSPWAARNHLPDKSPDKPQLKWLVKHLC